MSVAPAPLARSVLGWIPAVPGPSRFHLASSPRPSRRIGLTDRYPRRHASSLSSRSPTSAPPTGSKPPPPTPPGPSASSTKPSLSSSRASQLVSGSSAARSPSSSAHPATADWPFRHVDNPPVAGTTEIERVIFARPYEGPLGSRVRMLIFFVPFWGLVVGFWLTTPSPSERYRASRLGIEVEDIPKERETVWSVVKDYAVVGGVAATTVGCCLALLMPSRLITRLAQVKRRTVSPEGRPVTEQFLRVQHGGHLMMPGWWKAPRYRDVPRDDVVVKRIGMNSIQSPYLSLRIKSKRRFGFDTFGYRLDFRDTPLVKQTEDEVVLSLSRIEAVFGRLF